MELSAITAFIDNIPGKSRFGMILETATKARLSKAEAEAICGNRDAAVVKISRFHNCFIGRNYQRCVERHAQIDGFSSQKPSGMHWVANYQDFLLQSDKDEGKYYLRVAIDKNTRRENVYMIDGVLATATQSAQIESALAAKAAHSAKQAAYGVATAEEVTVRSFALDSILAVHAWGATAL